MTQQELLSLSDTLVQLNIMYVHSMSLLHLAEIQIIICLKY